MSNQLVTYPIFYVYRLTFQSGKTYIGMHKQKQENDSYITSSSYYLRHKEDDPLENKEILITLEDEFQTSFLETWCILSDKAYHKDTNVNYNLGNFFHQFSTGYHTPEEQRKFIEKGLLTKSKRTEEQKAITREKYRKTMASKSPEELAEIHRKQGIPGKRPKSEETKQKMSKASKSWTRRLTTEELCEFKKICSKIRKDWWKSSSEDKINKLKQKFKEREIKRWVNASEEEKRKRCKGFYEQSEKRKQKVKCIETGEIFNSLKDVQKWLGPKTKGCNISAQARGYLHFAYRHPITNQPLHWELVND